MELKRNKILRNKIGISEKLKCSKPSILPIACMLTILTYGDLLPDVIKNYLAYVVWAIVLVECVFTCKLKLPLRVIELVLPVVFFILIAGIYEILTTRAYLSSGVFSSMVISIGVLVCGALEGNKLAEEDFNVIARWFVIGSIVFSAYFIVDNIGTGFNLKTRLYIEDLNKNSVSQLVATAVYILILSFDRAKTKLEKAIRVLLILFLTAMTFLLRSRVTILCFGVAILLLLSSKLSNPKIKKYLTIGIVLTVIVVICNNNIRKIVVDQILFANRDRTDLNAITSGRVNIYSRFWRLLSGYELIGRGAKYYESFFLSVIIQFGVPLGLLIWAYVGFVGVTTYQHAKEISYGQLLCVLFVSYTLNGVFEGLPPFGPGTKNFFLWLLLGLCLSQYNKAAKKNHLADSMIDHACISGR